MKELILLIMNQTTILFENIEETIDAIDETQLDKDGSWEWPLGEQIYHLLHSLDQWFINPYDYEEPTFTGIGTSSSDGKINQKLYKSELVAYYTSIKAKITHYLCTLDDHSLKVGAFARRLTVQG